jgi:NADPH-dependent 2,4-dienoyl-CoA reductase/sulfur reductase-like enzyme
MGPDLGRFIQSLHEAKGVRFHLGRAVEAWDGARLSASGGPPIEADRVVLGVGVRPRLALAEAAGLAVEKGVLVDPGMRTSARGVFAAGDIARYPGPDGELVRIEHWVAAERQGQVAALSMLGDTASLTDPPFFWSMHYGTAIRYVGHAADWDEARIDGSLEAHDATVRYLKAGRLLAAASVGRDRENLEIGVSLRRAAG